MLSPEPRAAHTILHETYIPTKRAVTRTLRTLTLHVQCDDASMKQSVYNRNILQANVPFDCASSSCISLAISATLRVQGDSEGDTHKIRSRRCTWSSYSTTLPLRQDRLQRICVLLAGEFRTAREIRREHTDPYASALVSDRNCNESLQYVYVCTYVYIYLSSVSQSVYNFVSLNPATYDSKGYRYTYLLPLPLPP